MFALLNNFATRPVPFSEYTAPALWNDPHVSRQMLRFHLDPTTDRASRRPETMDACVAWLDQLLPLRGNRVCDLGCGPGLYATRFAALGAQVTGIDFSESSLAHARAEAKTAGKDITYLQADYTNTRLPAETDLFTLIFCDFCALSPPQRRGLLGEVHAALKPGGHFALDAYSMREFETYEEGDQIESRLMDGFWSANDYLGLKKSFKYPLEKISLDRYLIIEADEQREIYNWLQYFSEQSLADELRAAGFELEAVAGSLAGEALHEDSDLIGVFARAI
jgi:SAM-dependent methyltransferase